MPTLYLNASEISRTARYVDTRESVPLDWANDGWLDLNTGIVSDRYVSDIRIVQRNLTGAARYSVAVSLLRELRNSQASHHPHKGR